MVDQEDAPVQTDHFGWAIGWIGPRDYRCQYCKNGFMEDEIVYLDDQGFPFHSYCAQPTRKFTVISPEHRQLGKTS